MPMHDLGHEEDLKLPPFIVKEAKKTQKREYLLGEEMMSLVVKKIQNDFPRDLRYQPELLKRKPTDTSSAVYVNLEQNENSQCAEVTVQMITNIGAVETILRQAEWALLGFSLHHLCGYFFRFGPSGLP